MTTSATERPRYLPPFNILNGKVMGSCRSRHRSQEFLSFLQELEKEAPADLQIHLILDNYSTHKS
jgi:putative transposase